MIALFFLSPLIYIGIAATMSAVLPPYDFNADHPRPVVQEPIKTTPEEPQQ
jgi:hypothetical protein